MHSFHNVQRNIPADSGSLPENKNANTMKTGYQQQGMHRIRALILTSLLFSGATVRGATLWDGVYLDVFGGFSILTSGDLTQSGQTSDGSYDGGFLTGLAVGREISPAWAFELEWFYRNNGVDSMKGGVFDDVNDGDFASTNLMLNAIYTIPREDADTGFFARISPYVGLGIGVMQELDIDMTVAGAEQEYSDNWVPSAQIIAGAAYPISGGFSAFAELRYHFSGSPALDAESGGARVDADYNGYSVLIGLRRTF
jgi:hypothetical protein